MAENKYVDINNVRSEEMRQKWQEIIDKGIDPFDREHIEKVVGPIITETDHWCAFHNNYPYIGTRCQPVIVSKKFYIDDDDMSDDEWLDLRKIKKQLKQQLRITGGGFIMRFGDTNLSGGSVIHLHAQLIVPKEGKAVAAWFGSEKKE